MSFAATSLVFWMWLWNVGMTIAAMIPRMEITIINSMSEKAFFLISFFTIPVFNRLIITATFSKSRLSDLQAAFFLHWKENLSKSGRSGRLSGIGSAVSINLCHPDRAEGYDKTSVPISWD